MGIAGAMAAEPKLATKAKSDMLISTVYLRHVDHCSNRQRCLDTGS